MVPDGEFGGLANGTANPHSPRYLSMWSSIYRKYTVLGAKITVSCTGPGALNVSGVSQKIGLFTTDAAGASAIGGGNPTLFPKYSVASMREAPSVLGKSRTVPTDNTRCRLSHGWSFRRQKGVRSTLEDTMTGLTTGTNDQILPEDRHYFVVWAGSYGQTGNQEEDPPAVTMLFTIDYIVRFHDQYTEDALPDAATRSVPFAQVPNALTPC